MYARVVNSQLKPDAIDQAIAIWRDQVAPSLKTSNGFHSGYMTGDRQTGKGVVVTFWHSESDATEVDSSGQYQQSIALFAGLLVAPPSREQFEVLVQV
jgi:heme-degrading monooxygenase HmoA